MLPSLWLWPLESLLLFVTLTIYGAMWKGAEDQGRRGWVVALLWSVGLVIALNALGALGHFLGISWS